MKMIIITLFLLITPFVVYAEEPIGLIMHYTNIPEERSAEIPANVTVTIAPNVIIQAPEQPQPKPAALPRISPDPIQLETYYVCAITGQCWSTRAIQQCILFHNSATGRQVVLCDEYTVEVLW